MNSRSIILSRFFEPSFLLILVGVLPFQSWWFIAGIYVTVKTKTLSQRWSRIAVSYDLVPEIGPFPDISIPIEKLKVETRFKARHLEKALICFNILHCMKTNNEQNEREISKMETSFITVKFKKRLFHALTRTRLARATQSSGAH